MRLAILPLLLLTSCISLEPSPEEIAVANYGTPLVHELAAARLKAETLVRSLLKDPYSARFSWNEPYKGWLRSGRAFRYGYMMRTQVNAKNGFGAYSGYVPWAFLYEYGKLTCAGKPIRPHKSETLIWTCFDTPL